MLTDAEFCELLQETIYYYRPEDIIHPATQKRLKADLVKIGNKDKIWIPYSVRRPVQVVNLHTGEYFAGYVVKRHFVWGDPRKRRNQLRKHKDLEYDYNGTDVRHNKGWRTPSPPGIEPEKSLDDYDPALVF